MRLPPTFWPLTGADNATYLQKYLPGTKIDLVCVAERQQGIVSKEGLTLSDLPGRQFINREKGSGTRILLDYELGSRGIDPSTIPGYEREATTHIAVALAVKSGEADAGMCVYSAARVFGLPFVPVATERYELAIRQEHTGDPRVSTLVKVIRSAEFKGILESLGGYDIKETGVQRPVS